MIVLRHASLFANRRLSAGGCGSARKSRARFAVVATKVPRIAAADFAKKGIQPEIISVSGSVELAPLVGLADLIVDIVETGKTSEENNQLRAAEIRPLCAAIARGLGAC